MTAASVCHVTSADDTSWFGVRTLYLHGSNRYEERVVTLVARDFDHAVERAEAEAAEYVEGLDVEYLGLAQAFWMFDVPGDGAEVFSLMRDSDLPSETYLSRFFDNGDERQNAIDAD